MRIRKKTRFRKAAIMRKREITYKVIRFRIAFRIITLLYGGIWHAEHDAV
jgi:hypothetical protein